mmetsp:Transcript_20851/g.53448  ORF Transcript_20851/g.53448 Transcript_20851/m.53448 type:complete len:237 (-) Transcript_20851:207-917(-)
MCRGATGCRRPSRPPPHQSQRLPPRRARCPRGSPPAPRRCRPTCRGPCPPWCTCPMRCCTRSRSSRSCTSSSSSCAQERARLPPDAAASAGCPPFPPPTACARAGWWGAPRRRSSGRGRSRATAAPARSTRMKGRPSAPATWRTGTWRAPDMESRRPRCLGGAAARARPARGATEPCWRRLRQRSKSSSSRSRSEASSVGTGSAPSRTSATLPSWTQPCTSPSATTCTKERCCSSL